MSRFAYWTILIGTAPTSFRAGAAADLTPTLVQLQRKHPEARMVWFERGRVWSSPTESRAARDAERAAARKRPSTWRPGGRHEDPRQKYKDAKKAKWTRFKEGIRQRAEGRSGKPRHETEAGSRRTDPRPTGSSLLADWKPPPRPPGPGARSDSPARPPRPAGTPSGRDLLADWKPPPRPAERPGDRPAPTRPPSSGTSERPPGARDRRSQPGSNRAPGGAQGRGGTRPPGWSRDRAPREDSRPPGSRPAGSRPPSRRPASGLPPRKPRKP